MGDLGRLRWVEIGFVVLTPEQRPPNLPSETRAVPYYARVRGFVAGTPAVGGTVEIETLTGRRIKGELLQIDPPFTHGFGRPVQELVEAGRDAERLLWPDADRPAPDTMRS
jgi:hypothetical protein